MVLHFKRRLRKLAHTSPCDVVFYGSASVLFIGGIFAYAYYRQSLPGFIPRILTLPAVAVVLTFIVAFATAFVVAIVPVVVIALQIAVVDIVRWIGKWLGTSDRFAIGVETFIEDRHNFLDLYFRKRSYKY